MSIGGLAARAAAYAALGDPSRLAIIDRLANADLASGELADALGLPTNLIAHHLRVLEDAVPPIMRIVVDLPAPLGPSRPNDSPDATAKEIASTARRSP